MRQRHRLPGSTTRVDLPHRQPHPRDPEYSVNPLDLYLTCMTIFAVVIFICAR